MRKTLVTVGLLALVILPALGQRVYELRVANLAEPTPVRVVLDQIQTQHGIRVFYLEGWLDNYMFSPDHSGLLLTDALDAIFQNSDISFSVEFDYALVFLKDPALHLIHDSLIQTLSRRKVTQTVVGNSDTAYGNAHIRGKVTDAAGQPMTNVVIIIDGGKHNTLSDASGSFSFTLKRGPHILEARHVNFDPSLFDIDLRGDGELQITMYEETRLLEEVEITDNRTGYETTGATRLDMSDLRRAPVFIGEADIFKQIQLKAGVTTTGEIASGFNVRGGSVDQNLILYDGVPILNTSHALGFFSSFNADAVSDVSFYRGGIPAEYGGRVSSVLDIQSRNGNPERWNGSGGIGIISSFLSFNGPIRRNSTTAAISFRTSYSNWILDKVKTDYQNLSKTSVDFFDGSIKLNHRFPDKSSVTLSGYISRDAFSLSNDTLYVTENTAASIQFNRQVNATLSATATILFGKFAYTMSEPDARTSFDLDYEIAYPGLKLDFAKASLHRSLFGLHATFYTVQPGRIKPASVESAVNTRRVDREQGIELAGYFSKNIMLTTKLSLEPGLRVPVFLSFGPGNVFSYANKIPDATEITDTTRYSNLDVAKAYTGIEPRLTLNYNIDNTSSVKVGYHRVNQFLHLINNTSAVTPIDIWQISNTFFKPQIADQLSAGYYRTLGKTKQFDSFLEVFYKHVSNVLDFRDGANLILNPALETALLPGRATSYGVEMSIAKNKGRLTGDIQYSYSRSFRQSYTKEQQIAINKGRRYPSNYDQPHVATITWRYGLSRRYFISGTFTYHTGRPISLPVANYAVQDIPVSGFSDRNLYRMPDYHRLDLAFIMEGNHRKKKLWDGTWVLSFYNVYGRENPYAVFFQYSPRGFLEPYKLSIIGSVIPSLSYNFKF